MRDAVDLGDRYIFFLRRHTSEDTNRTWSRVSPCATIPPSFPLPATTARESPAFAAHTFKPRTKATTAVQPPKSALMPAAGKAALMSRYTSSKALWTTTTSADRGGGGRRGLEGGAGGREGGGSFSHVCACLKPLQSDDRCPRPRPRGGGGRDGYFNPMTGRAVCSRPVDPRKESREGTLTAILQGLA